MIKDKKRVVVLGGGESGVGAAILAKLKGFEVFISDFGEIPAKYKEELTERGIPFEEGGHTPELLLNADEVIKSPGIPLDAPMVKAILEQGIPVISEIEFAGRYTNAKMLCITGSNGKTTTTMLTCKMLRAAGVDASEAGNIGLSLARQVALAPRECYVIELSSFQLDNMYDFRADVAVLLNITPDHLDRYDNKFENYARAKMRISQNQRPDDYFIIWEDDAPTASLLKERNGKGKLLTFGMGKKEAGAWLNGDKVELEFVKNGKVIHRSFNLANLPLKGEHNLRNAMAAALACVAAYGDERNFESFISGMRNFKAVEHRLEPAGIIDGATYINDSKATNVDSTFYALGSMSAPTILILGGKDKGNDYTQIEPLVKEKVKGIVCMGLHNEKLIDFFTGKVTEIADTHTLEDAMRAAREMASEGDVVLLSPCCASFDLFNSYEDRGRQFKAWVKRHSNDKN